MKCKELHFAKSILQNIPFFLLFSLGDSKNIVSFAAYSIHGKQMKNIKTT